MRTTRIYEPIELAVNQTIELSASNHNHLAKVLRLKPGARLRVFNGTGAEYTAVLDTVTKRYSAIRLLDEDYPATESPLHISLGQGLSRGERMDWAIQKSTELGVTEITPLFAGRSEVKLSAERQTKRIEHWCQVAKHAAEQSGRVKLPQIHSPATLDSWIAECEADLKLVLTPEIHAEAPQINAHPKTVALLIGPEGGFDNEEVEQAVACGFQRWQIGPRVLRTETAPAAALSILNLLWGDISNPFKQEL